MLDVRSSRSSSYSIISLSVVLDTDVNNINVEYRAYFSLISFYSRIYYLE